MSATTRKLRILCLHGYRQNALLFREKTGSIRKMMKNFVDFDFVSAPLVPNHPESDEGGRRDAKAWWFSKPDDKFSSRDVSTIATGFDVSVRTVIDYIQENGPFDGLLGFSQGAAMVHLLLAMGKLNEISLEIKFVIFFSGFLSLSSVHEGYVNVDLDIPSLHIYGLNDDIVLSSTSEKLTLKFDNPLVITHDGGHFVPTLSKSKQNVIKFLERQMELISVVA